MSAEDGIQDGCLELGKSCGLLLPPDERCIFLAKHNKGLRICGTDGNMNLDEVDQSKETSDLVTNKSADVLFV